MQAGNTHQEWNRGQITAHEHTEMAPQSQIPISLVGEPGGKDSAMHYPLLGGQTWQAGPETA